MKGSSLERWLLLALVLAAAAGLGSSCNPPKIRITSPAHGSFSTDSTVTLSGTVANVGISNHKVRVNGSLATLNADGSWSIVLPLDAGAIVNPFLAELVRISDNVLRARARIVVHAGSSVADGDFSLDAVALRLDDSGLDQVEPLIESGVDLDLASLIPVGTVLINNQCFVDAGIFGCWGRATVTVVNPPPSIAGFSIGVDSQTNFVDGDIAVSDADVRVFIDGTGLVPDCGLQLTADTTNLFGDYALAPDPVDASTIDVNLLGALAVSFSGFEQTFTSGACDDFLIGDIIQAFIGDLEDDVVDALRDFLADPDGSGPLDSPIADAIEVALADISITGPIGEALQVSLEAPLFDVVEDPLGITLGSDTRITSSAGGGPGQCQPPAGAPDLAASFHVAEAFPSFGATTPVGGLPYDLGLCISTSGFNQLLKAQTECGLLRTSITEIDLGEGPLPLTAGVLALLIPQLGTLDPDTPLRVDLLPSLAPLLTGNAGPGGELGEIRMPHLVVELWLLASIGAPDLLLRGAADFRAGLGMAFDDLSGSLLFSVSSLTPEDVTVAILQNPIFTNEAILLFALPSLFAELLPQLGEGLGAFPLPDFLGLQLEAVEVSRSGQFYSLFADLVPAP